MSFFSNVVKLQIIPNIQDWGWEGSIRKTHPRRLKDPDVFLNALGDFPGRISGDSVEDLSSPRYGEIWRVVDTIPPGHLIAADRVWRETRYTEELQPIKSYGRPLKKT